MSCYIFYSFESTAIFVFLVLFLAAGAVLYVNHMKSLALAVVLRSEYEDPLFDFPGIGREEWPKAVGIIKTAKVKKFRTMLDDEILETNIASENTEGKEYFRESAKLLKDYLDAVIRDKDSINASL